MLEMTHDPWPTQPNRTNPWTTPRSHDTYTGWPKKYAIRKSIINFKPVNKARVWAKFVCNQEHIYYQLVLYILFVICDVISYCASRFYVGEISIWDKIYTLTRFIYIRNQQKLVGKIPLEVFLSDETNFNVDGNAILKQNFCLKIEE